MVKIRVGWPAREKNHIQPFWKVEILRKQKDAQVTRDYFFVWVAGVEVSTGRPNTYLVEDSGRIFWQVEKGIFVKTGKKACCMHGLSVGFLFQHSLTPKTSAMPFCSSLVLGVFSISDALAKKTMMSQESARFICQFDFAVLYNGFYSWWWCWPECFTGNRWAKWVR